VKLLEPFQNDTSPTIRREALIQLTTYRSKKVWHGVDNLTAQRIRVNELKIKKKQKYLRNE